METINFVVNIISLVYIILPLFLLLILFILYLSGRKFSPERLDKLLDFGKWYIVSVALVFIVRMMESSFTERDTGIKEMQVYDKYAETILKANNIEERWKLSQYFSTVTPTPRLRDRWIEYKDSIKSEYVVYKELKRLENSIKSKDSLSRQDIDSLVKLQLKLDPYEKSLAEISRNDDQWIIIFTADKDLKQAQQEQRNLQIAGISDVRLVFRDNVYRNISQNFSSKTDAQNYLNRFRNVVRKDVYMSRTITWCSDYVFNGVYYECK